MSFDSAGGSLELWVTPGAGLLQLDGDRVAIGKADANDVILDDPRVSRFHAVIERYASGWVVRDLGSLNGTYVNGERIAGDRALRPGDEIGIGETRLGYRSNPDAGTATATRTELQAPSITRREREILVELCRPVFADSIVAEPATVSEIAASLFITDSAVKKHLSRLYDRFGLTDDGERRRGRLAAIAIQSGAVRSSDVRSVGA